MTRDLPELADLHTAEDFLDHFGIVYDPATIGPLRVPVLRLFKRYLAAAMLPDAVDARREALRDQLQRAYGETAARGQPRPPDAAIGDRPGTFVPLSAISDGLPS